MTAGQPLTEILPAAQVAELINSVVKALRAFHMYLPNNPIYQRATENVRAAFTPIWSVLDQVVLTVAETDFVWEEQVVYHQPAKGESLAWGLFKDGMRSLTIRRGAEDEELTRFLETVNQARYLAADAGDDLLTLLWQQEFQFIQYHFVEFFGEGGGSLPEASGAATAGGNDAETVKARHAQAVEEAPPRPKGVVDLEDFDSTLYFLDEAEINAVAADLQEEYRRDARGAAINVLFDLFELQGEPSIRDEILGSLEGLFPNFLNARDFRTAAAVLRDAKVVAGRAPGLTPEHRARLEAFVTKLSEPAIVSQLVQSLDEASAHCGPGRGGRGAAGAPGRGAGAGARLAAQAVLGAAARSAGRRGGPAGHRARQRGAADPAGSRFGSARRRGAALRPADAAPGGAGPGRGEPPSRRHAAPGRGPGAGPARHPGGAGLHRAGDRGRRPRGPPRRRARGRRPAATRARSSGWRAWCSGAA